METFTFEEQCVIIQFLHLRGMKPIEIHQQLSETCNVGVMDVKSVCSWVRQFTEGRMSCENKPKEPPPRGTHRRNFPQFQVVMQGGVHRSNGYAGIGSCLSHSQAAVFHNHLFHLRNHVFRLASAWRRLLRFVFTRRSAVCELSYPRTHIFHVHNAIIACLTQLLMNFNGFHATQVEESDNQALLFECKRRHFQYVKHYCHSTTSQAFNT